MVYPLRIRSCIAPAVALSMAGCSMHPLPDNAPFNFPRASTFDVVHQVRCEAKAGLDPLRRGRNRAHVEKIIAATSIGYDFRFVMTEQNDLNGGALTLKRLSSPPSKVEINVTGEATRSRQNERNFRIVEGLADVANMKDADCSDAARANLAYPISGRLRVDEVVRTYLRLERISDLDDDETIDVGADGNSRAGVFSETLLFKTHLSVGARPTLTLNAVVGRYRVTRAALGGAVASRTDDHSLIIAFAQAPNFKDDEFNRKVGRARDQRRSFVGRGNKVVRGARTESAIAQASTEFAHNQVALELARRRNLLDDEQDGARFLGEQLLRGLRPPDETGPGD